MTDLVGDFELRRVGFSKYGSAVDFLDTSPGPRPISIASNDEEARMNRLSTLFSTSSLRDHTEALLCMLSPLSSLSSR